MAADPNSTDQEFTDREKRALKHLARDALEKMPNRRSFLAGLTGAAAAGAVGYNEGVQQAQAAASTSDSDGDVGTPSSPVDVFADGVDATSLDVDELGDGPIAFSSRYTDYQSALDAAGSGRLLIDDTKTEEGIGLKAGNDGVVIEWVGDNWVEQPASPTAGVPVFGLADNVNSDISVTFIRPRIRNPNLADADIKNEATLTGSDRTSAISGFHPALTAGTGRVQNLTVIDPLIHHINGYGVRGASEESVTVRGGHIYRTAFDSMYSSGGTEKTVVFRDCRAGWSGRHNFAVTDGDEETVHISGVGRDAYTAGIDLETGKNTHLDVDIHNPTRSGNTGNVKSGLNVDSGSENVSGSVRVYDANNHSASIAGNCTDLSIYAEHTAGTENPNGTHEVRILSAAGTGGDIDIHVVGGGSDYACFVTNVSEWDIDIYAEETYGAAARIDRCSKLDLDVRTHDPCQGAGSITAAYLAHLEIGGSSSVSSLDNDITLIGTDNDGNANYGITSADGFSDWSRISGNVRGAYSTSATNNLGANADTSDLTS